MYTTPYAEWFEYRPEHEEKIYIYAQNPAKLTHAEIERADSRTARDIAELESLVESMKLYRQTLANRYNELSTLPYKNVLNLKRDTSRYRGNILYKIDMLRVYQDGTKDIILQENYTGNERQKAIKRFETLKKEHPGIEANKDIIKHSWKR